MTWLISLTVTKSELLAGNTRTIARPIRKALVTIPRIFRLTKAEKGLVNAWVSRLLTRRMIESAFGSFDNMKSEFAKAAMTRFGSGWAWLCVDSEGDLFISSTANQDNPLMDNSGTPILGIDVWEHAYYKKYGPGRGDYINAWWNVVDWPAVATLFNSAN